MWRSRPLLCREMSYGSCSNVPPRPGAHCPDQKTTQFGNPNWFPGSAWEPRAREALPREAEPHTAVRSQAEPGNEMSEAVLPLVDRQGAVVQLQDRQVAGGREQGADVALGPAAVAALAGGQVIKDHVAILAPRQPLRFARLRKHLGITLVAQHVNGLPVVIVRVLPVPEAVAAGLVDGNGGLAVLEPLPGERRVVFAGAEQAGDGRGRQRRTFGAVEGAAIGQAIDDAAALGRALFQIIVGLVD